MPILNDVDLESTFYYFSWQPFGWMFEPTLMLPEESRLFCKADEDGFTDTLSLAVLLQREGFQAGFDRVYRIWRR